MLDEHPDNGRAFRLLVLQTHYRKTMEVNPELMASARTAVQRLDALSRRARASGIRADPIDYNRVMAPCSFGDWGDGRWVILPAAPAGPMPTADPEWDQAATEAFRTAMDNDIGTPEAVAVVFDTLHRANAALDGSADDAPTLVATVVELAGALGVAVDAAERGSDAGDITIDGLVARRQAAREAKDWATADALRDELSALGVVVEDTPAGTVWHRG
ncbi:MAG: hypothetical protein OXC00_16105 [Acidimicrobiaceae bacterium]|nr:hypothetical protein [Acidimicrobiaceae bacterium]